MRTNQADWIVDEVFRTDLAAGYKGFFIEAGAADGVTSSNTNRLEQEFGWGGLLVEPNVAFFSRLTNARKAHAYNVVLSDKDGETEFIQASWNGTATEHVRAVYDRRSLNVYDGALYKKDVGGKPATIGALPCKTLATIFKEISAPAVIDYFSLDVEGGELHVLKGFPFDTHKIRALTLEAAYEWDGLFREHDHRAPCRALLESHGYRFVRTIDFDDCYVYGG